MDKLAKTSSILDDPEGALVAVRTAMEALEGESLSPWDLPEITVPAGGGTTWELATVDGDISEKEVTAVILDSQRVRQYYANKFDGGSAPPDCASADGNTGVGSPGGDCATCPLAQWGSAENNSQACGERRHVLLLTAHSNLPVFFNVPPSSIKALKQYLMGLAGAGQSYFQVTTKITLAKAKSATGIEYSKAVFTRVAPLDAKQAAVAAEYRATVRGLLARRIVEAPRPVNEIDVDDFTN
jgi:hypothetical protein